MIGLCLLMAGDDSRMAGGESRMTGDCCRADSIQPDLYIDAYARIHTCMPYIYGLVALLDNLQSSFSSITISIWPSKYLRVFWLVVEDMQSVEAQCSAKGIDAQSCRSLARLPLISTSTFINWLSVAGFILTVSHNVGWFALVYRLRQFGAER
jgi:hypothetical protein